MIPVEKPVCLIFLNSGQKDRQLDSFLLAARDLFQTVVITLDSNNDWLKQFCKAHSFRFLEMPSRNFLRQILFFRRITLSPKSKLFVCSHTYQVGKLVALARLSALFPGRRKFYWLHFRHHNLLHHLQKKKRALFVDRVINRLCDYQVVPSRECRDTLVAEGCEQHKVWVHEHFIDSKMLEGSEVASMNTRNRIFSGDSPIRIIAVGRIDWQKNYTFFLDVIQILISKIPVIVNIFGVGNRHEIENLARGIYERGLEESVEYRGATDEIDKILLQHDLMLHLSRDESFGLAVAESLILGVPVISSNAGSLRLFSPFSLLQVDTLDAKTVADQIGELLTSTDGERLSSLFENQVLRAQQLFARDTNFIVEYHRSLLERFKTLPAL